MKKIKFFAMALAALAMFSCSKEQVSNSGGKKGIGEPTYATFTFNTGTKAGTKGTKDDAETDAGKGTEATEKRISSVRLLIFDDLTKILETNTKVDFDTNLPTASVTTIVKAGKKKMYIVANEASSPKVVAALTAMTEGSSRLDQFYDLRYDAGTTNVDSGFSLEELYTSNVIAGQERGFPMSSPEAEAYTFVGGITKEVAENASSGESKNRFAVNLDFMVAKVAVAKSQTLSVPSDFTVGEMHFAIRNIARETFITQHIDNGIIKGCYYDWIPSSNVNDPASWATNYHQSPKATVQVKTKAGTGMADVAADQVFVYTAENTKSTLTNLEGGATYAAVKCIINPKTSYDGTNMMWSVSEKKVALGTPANHTPTTTFIKTLTALHTVPANTIFKDEATYLKALAMGEFQEKYNNETQPSSLPTEDEHYQVHNGGETWYRVFIGNDVNGKTVFGVNRGTKYVATINAINAIGSATEDLNPDTPLDQDTYISVTVTAKGWTNAGSGVDL